jgi:hypothetical protein
VFIAVMLVLAVLVGGLAALGVAAFRAVARSTGSVSLVVLSLVAGGVLAWASGV